MEATKKISEKMIRLQEIDKEQDELNHESSELKNKILESMDEDCVNEYTYDDGEDKLLSAKMVEKKQVNFDFNKILGRLNKSQVETICDKIMIIDREKLKSILIDHPEIKAIIKPAITIQKNVNDEKFQVAIDRGIITEKDVEGCYIIKESRYLKIQRKKK